MVETVDGINFMICERNFFFVRGKIGGGLVV